MSQVYLGIGEKLLADTVISLVGELEQFESVTSKLEDADVIVLSIIDDLAKATKVLHKLKASSSKTPRETPQTLILVSPLHTWGETPIAVPYISAGDEEDADGNADVEAAAGADGQSRCFSDETYASRVARPSHVVHHELEQMALSLAHDELRTCVIAAGVMYGNGEAAFLPVLRDAWLGRSIPLPRLSDDTPASQTALPTIHVRDLAKAILSAAIMEDDLPSPYIVAVDHSTDSLHSILRAVQQTFQQGTDAHSRDPAQELTADETLELLVKDEFWSSLSLNLAFTAESRGSIDLLVQGIGEGTWECKEGMVTNIEAVTEGFRNAHDLRPVRLHVIAAPYVNKEAVCAELAKEYYLQVVDPQTALREILEETPASVDGTESAAKDGDADEADGDNEPEPSIVEVIRQASVNGTKLEAVTDGLLVNAMKHYLGRACFRKHGYILCGYPEKRDCAMDYFEIEEEVVGEGLEKKQKEVAVDPEGSEGADDADAADTEGKSDDTEDEAKEAKEEEEVESSDSLPEHTSVIYLSGSHEVLHAHGVAQGVADKEVEKVLKKYAESLGKGQNTASTFLIANAPAMTWVVPVPGPPPQSLADSIVLQEEYDEEEWEAISEEDREAITHYKDDVAIHQSQVTAQMKALCTAVERKGKTFNFHPTIEEQVLIDAEKEADEMSRDLIRRQTKVEREKKKEKAARKKEIFARGERRRLADEDANELEVRAKPLRQYLMKHIMPVLTQGLIECCKNEPADPVDYLAEFLFRAKVESPYEGEDEDDADTNDATAAGSVVEEKEAKEGV